MGSAPVDPCIDKDFPLPEHPEDLEAHQLVLVSTDQCLNSTLLLEEKIGGQLAHRGRPVAVNLNEGRVNLVAKPKSGLPGSAIPAFVSP